MNPSNESSEIKIMSYRSIIVFLDHGKRSKARLAVALQLAVAHKAHLTAIYLYYMPFDPSINHAVSAPLLTEYKKELTQQEKYSYEDFLASCTASNVMHHWIAASTYEASAAIAYARCCDLVVAGQFNPHDPLNTVDHGFMDRLLLAVGRPVLIVPRHEARIDITFPHILVAWNGSRDAARAITDALPLLKRAEDITVITAHKLTQKEAVQSAIPPPDILAYLRHHALDAVVIEQAEHCMDDGDWILARSGGLDLRADLIVTGAYGHARLNELLLGGVTRTLLHSAIIPVLMSH
jgi:nucleotide-binding universal stress UspA family protein